MAPKFSLFFCLSVKHATDIRVFITNNLFYKKNNSKDKKMALAGHSRKFQKLQKKNRIVKKDSMFARTWVETTLLS